MKEGFIFNCADCGKKIRVNHGEVYSIYFHEEDIYKEFCKECALKSIDKEKR